MYFNLIFEAEGGEQCFDEKAKKQKDVPRIAAALLWIATEEAVSIVVCMLRTLSFAVDGSMPSYQDGWEHSIIYSGYAD